MNNILYLELAAVVALTLFIARASLVILRHAVFLHDRKCRRAERDRFRRLAPFDQEWM